MTSTTIFIIEKQFKDIIGIMKKYVQIYSFGLLHFLKDKGRRKNWTYIYSYRVCYTFILIFKFIFIYLLYVLFVLKIEGNFRKRNSYCNTLLLLSDNTREYNEYSRNRCYVFTSKFKQHAYIRFITSRSGYKSYISKIYMS